MAQKRQLAETFKKGVINRLYHLYHEEPLFFDRIIREIYLSGKFNYTYDIDARLKRLQPSAPPRKKQSDDHLSQDSIDRDVLKAIFEVTDPLSRMIVVKNDFFTQKISEVCYHYRHLTEHLKKQLVEKYADALFSREHTERLDDKVIIKNIDYAQLKQQIKIFDKALLSGKENLTQNTEQSNSEEKYYDEALLNFLIEHPNTHLKIPDELNNRLNQLKQSSFDLIFKTLKVYFNDIIEHNKPIPQLLTLVLQYIQSNTKQFVKKGIRNYLDGYFLQNISQIYMNPQDLLPIQQAVDALLNDKSIAIVSNERQRLEAGLNATLKCLNNPRARIEAVTHQLNEIVKNSPLRNIQCNQLLMHLLAQTSLDEDDVKIIRALLNLIDMGRLYPYNKEKLLTLLILESTQLMIEVMDEDKKIAPYNESYIKELFLLEKDFLLHYPEASSLLSTHLLESFYSNSMTKVTALFFDALLFTVRKTLLTGSFEKALVIAKELTGKYIDLSSETLGEYSEIHHVFNTASSTSGWIRSDLTNRILRVFIDNVRDAAGISLEDKNDIVDFTGNPSDVAWNSVKHEVFMQTVSRDSAQLPLDSTIREAEAYFLKQAQHIIEKIIALNTLPLSENEALESYIDSLSVEAFGVKKALFVLTQNIKFTADNTEAYSNFIDAFSYHSEPNARKEDLNPRQAFRQSYMNTALFSKLNAPHEILSTRSAMHPEIAPAISMARRDSLSFKAESSEPTKDLRPSAVREKRASPCFGFFQSSDTSIAKKSLEREPSRISLSASSSARRSLSSYIAGMSLGVAMLAFGAVVAATTFLFSPLAAVGLLVVSTVLFSLALMTTCLGIALHATAAGNWGLSQKETAQSLGYQQVAGLPYQVI
jgi:hypothetical protein